MTPFDVVVVGAGFAGLAAASALAADGARVLVLDARPQLGGRATAFRDRVTGELVDNGQHVMFGCYRETLAFLDRIGASGLVHRQPALTVPYLDRDGRRSELRCGGLPPPLHLLEAVLRWQALPWADRLSIVRMARPLLAARRELAATGAIALDGDRTVSAWLRSHRQGPMLIDWLWDPLAVAALNQSPDEALAGPFVRVLAEMFGPDRAAAAMVIPARPLHLMYAEPARAFIERHGGAVRTSALARVVAGDRGMHRVEVRDASGDRPQTFEVGNVVIAVPWFALAAVFPTVPPALAAIVAAATSMTSKAIVTVNLWYDRRVMEEPFVGLPGRTMQWVFDKRLAFGGDASHLSLVASGADAMAAEPTDVVVARAAREVEDALPGARGAVLRHGTVIREKRATFSLAAGEPPRPGTTTGIDGIVLAGDWIATGLPGTIESAVVSGHRAANSLKAQGSGLRAQGSGPRAQGPGLRAQG